MTMLVRPKTLLSSILLVAWCLGRTPAAVADTPPQHVARYTFTTDECMNGSFAGDPTQGFVQTLPFHRDLVTTKCSKGLGVESVPDLEWPNGLDAPPLSMETSSATKLFQSIKQRNNGITFELWIKPFGADRDAISTVFAVGPTEGTPSNGDRDPCDDGNFDLQLATVEGKFQVTFRSSDSLFSSCFRYSVFDFPVQSEKVIHVVIALRDSHQQVFFNGQGATAASEDFSNNLDHWSAESTLHFFSRRGSATESYDENLWQGSLLRLSLYDRALSLHEVKQSLQAGLTGGLPFSIPYQVVINEDAERVPGSHAPVWYDSPPIVSSRGENEAEDLQRLPLRIGTIEDEVREMLASVNLDAPQNTPVPSQQYVYITSLPSKGSLYHFSGQFFVKLQSSPELQSNEAPMAILIEDSSSLIFLPNYNEFSATLAAQYATVSYCVSNKIIFDPRQCDSSAISIVVDSVNDPPVAFSWPSSLTTSEGLDWEQLPSIELGGTDTDQGDIISAIQITEPPRWGDLILRVTEFREDGVFHGASISDSNPFTVPSQNRKSIHVKYVFSPPTPASTLQPIPGNGASDLFRFRVSDRDGVWSLPKSVRVDIGSTLQAAHTLAPGQYMHTNNITVMLHAHDTSGNHRPLAYFFEAVPHHENGLLLQLATDKRLLTGSTILSDSDDKSVSSAVIAFVPNLDSCGISELPAAGNFTYRAVALQDGAPVSVSPSLTQPLEAPCFYNPLFELSISAEPLVLENFRLNSAHEIGCGASVYDQSRFSGACSTVAEINAIKVTASDNHINPLMVTLLSGKGYVSFNNEFWHTVKPIRGRRNMATEEVTFLARPENLQGILTGLSFRSQNIGDDVLTVSVQYGDCFGETKFAPCQRVNKKIPVHVTEGEPDGVYEPISTPLRWQVWLSWFGYPLAYVVIAIFKDLLKTATLKAIEIIVWAIKCMIVIVSGGLITMCRKTKVLFCCGSCKPKSKPAETGGEPIQKEYDPESACIQTNLT